jgi:glycosyltransferase involved in cell wall biosynthesis
VSSTAEVAGQATLLIDPLSVDQIRDALIALLTDEPLRGRLIAAGFAQAAQFTWSRAARQLRDIYARLLE